MEGPIDDRRMEKRTSKVASYTLGLHDLWQIHEPFGDTDIHIVSMDSFSKYSDHVFLRR